MKTKTIVFLISLLLIVLAGCNNTPPNENDTQPFSFSAGSELTVDKQQTETAASEAQEPQSIESISESDTMVLNAEVQTEQESRHNTTQSKAEQEKSQATVPKQTQQEQTPINPPVEEQISAETPSQPPAMTESIQGDQSKPIHDKSIYDYNFDVEAIRQELLSVGISMGLTIDSSLTPENSSWGNPIVASKEFQGEGLERCLKDYVQSMPELITTYGGTPIQYFTIYVESLGSGSYRFYFLY